jgi:hypothetical protein
MNRRVLIVAGIALSLGVPGSIEAQRGRGGQAAPVTAKAAAPVDLTGYWVSVITEDWRYRMVTPKKGDYPSIPLNAEGRRVADAWDPARDEASGDQCKSYGAGNIMRVPGNVHITWENDNTLRVDTEAGTQTRLFHFAGSQSPAGAPGWQGNSAAQWEIAGGGRGGRGAAAQRGGDLKVVTTGMRPGYLQKNGVPYSGNAVVTEYFHRTMETNGDSWLIVTTMIEDLQYLNQQFQRSTHFKKLPDGSSWSPTPCAAR